jgi:hypothetical protein
MEIPTCRCEKIELRYVYDCENLSNSLEYRHVENGKPITKWMKVPSVYAKAGDYADPPVTP